MMFWLNFWGAVMSSIFINNCISFIINPEPGVSGSAGAVFLWERVTHFSVDVYKNATQHNKGKIKPQKV